ncbi:hypothetical protein FOA52_001477 [Chlamydomonas sp. UWO 241]|nr:hypothetical protein FOA52_001477 [Chlamydomonas sp. UWO 241]
MADSPGDAAGADAPPQYMALTFPQQTQPLYTAYAEIAASGTACKHSNFLKGARWSPDGACLLTASDDNWLRIYDLPQDALECPAVARTAVDGLRDAGDAEAAASDAASAEAASGSDGQGGMGDSLPVALRVQEGETIYDMAWYPLMSAADPATCCFATTSRAHPIHLWDACTGALRCTYRGFNDVDEVTPAFSTAFSADGSRLIGGYNKSFLMFDVSRPGRDYAKKVSTHAKRRPDESLPGMVSALAFSGYETGGHLVAVGSYGGGIALYDARTWEMTYLLKGHKGGVTQVRFTPDGNFLLSGARQDGDLICWDLREGCTGELYRMPRDTRSTNQRVGFSVEPCGRHVATGGSGGCVRVFDLQTGRQVDDVRVSLDTVNGCDFHPNLNLLAVATGHRRYPITSCNMDVDSSDAGSDADAEGEGRGGEAGGLGKRAGAADRSRVRGGGVENAVRVLRLNYEMLDCLPGPEEVE